MLGAGQVLHVLLVEREDADALAIQQALTDAGIAYTLERARNDREFRALLSSRFDIVIADWHFSARDRMRASDLMRQRDIDVPLIFISDHGADKSRLLTREPYLIQVLKDISLRKHEEQKQRVAEARLARARRAQQVLLECNRALAYETREDRLLDEMCRALVHSGGFLRACIALVTAEGRKPVVTSAVAGCEDLPAAVLARLGAGDRAVQRVIRTGEADLARHIESEADPQQGDPEYRARYAAPLHVDGACVGALCVYAREPDAFDHDDVALLNMLAKDLAYGMSALRRESARQRAEAQLARVLRARSVMAECNHALVHATDEPELLREMCRILVQSGGYVQAWIGFATGNPKRPVRIGAHAGFGDSEPMGSQSSWDANGRYCGPMGDVISSGQPVLARHVMTADHPSWDRQRAQELGYQSAYLMPLVVEGRVIGAISIHAGEPDAFDEEEIRLVGELADDLAFGITALRTRVAREYAERQLRASERRYRETFNQAAVGITRVDLHGVLTDANQKFCDMLGYAVEEVIGKPVRDITHPDDVARGERARIRAATRVVRPWSDEKRYLARDGRAVWTRRTTSVGCDDHGRAQYLISVIEDVTASKALEQRFEATFNQAAVGIMHSSLQRRVMLVNQRLCEMLGYSAEELADRPEHTLHHPVDAHADEALENKLVSGEIRTFSLEKRYIRKDDRVIWCRRTVSLARDADARPLYLIGVFEDITERKEVEERYRATVQQAPVGIVHTALDGTILQVNPRFCEIVGYAEADLLKMTHAQIAHPVDAGQQHSVETKRLLQGRIQSFASEERLLRRNGAAIWVRGTVSVVRDSARAPLYLVRIVEDITGTREAEERYRATFDNAPVGILHTGIEDDRILKVNHKLCEILGYSAEELLERRTTDLLDPATRRRDRPQYFDQMLAGEMSSFSSERLFVRKDGSKVWTNRTVSVVRDAAGKPLYFLRIIEDISERKRAQLALERTAQLNALLKQLATAANEAETPEEALRACLAHLSAFGGWVLGRVVIFDRMGANYAEQMSIWHGADARWQRFVDASEPFAPLPSRGLLSRVFADGQAMWIEDLPAEPAVFRRAEAAKACGLRSAFAFPVVAAGHSYALIELYADRALPRDEALLQAVPTISAQLARVAERHLAENALTESERFARATMDALSQHICVVDEDGTIMAVNKSWRRFAEDNGYRADTTWEHESFFMTSETATGMSAAEVAYVASGMRDVLSGAQDEFTTEYSCHANAEQRWFAVKVTRFPAGGPGRAVISFENITERALSHRRRAMEHAVTRVLAESSTLSEAMPRLIRTMCEAMDWAYGALWSWDEEAELLRRVECWSERPLELEERDRRYWEVADTRGVGGLLRRGLYEREATWIVDVQADASFLRRPSAQKLGLASAYAFPIIAMNKVIGMMEFFGRDVRQPDEMLLLITRSVGSQIGQYIQRKQAEQALRESEEKFVQLSSNIPQVFWISDAQLRETIYLSPACEQMLGLPVDTIKRLPRLLVRAVHPEDRARVYHARKTAADGRYDETYRIVRADGTVRWVQDRAFPVRDSNDRVYRVAGIAEDITDRKEAEERLLYLAHYDALTGLPNRNRFYDRLTQSMAQARRRNKLVAVMFLDLDRFKVTNDTLGHGAGDDLLVQVAQRLSDRVRVGDTVGRFGGDEFGFILSDLRHLEDTRAVAEKIMGAFREPFMLGSSEVYVSASIGISVFPVDSDEEGTLMKNADAAMYRAKEMGRNNFQFYTAEMNARALQRLEMENSLRRALERREFRFHYQPKVDLVTGRITGMEALLRWMRPGRGMVQPADFVPLLEDSGLIVSIGKWLLEEACLQLKAWESAGITGIPIAINLSARQFASRDLGKMIEQVLSHHGLPPDLLQLELTESSLMSNTDDAVQTLRELKSLGMHLSIDDFGTGYSSLAYLQLFPIDALKIDRSFVSDITSDLDDATIIRAVIGMAHNLGLRVVAEGVENEAQLSFLVANGCDEIQGFYYSPPLTGDESLAMLLDPPPLQLDFKRSDEAAG